MKNNGLSYAFLQPVLQEFLSATMASADDIYKLPTSPNPLTTEGRYLELIEQGIITQDEFNQWIRPVASIPIERLALLASLQSQYSQTRQDSPIRFSAVPQPTSKTITNLQWVVLHIHLLNLPDLNPATVYQDTLRQHHINPLYDFNFPVHQCYFCGHYDSSETKFSRKHQRFCHTPECKNIHLSNPDMHPSCCAGKWGLIRRAFKEKVRYYRNKHLLQEDLEAKLVKAFQTYMGEAYRRSSLSDKTIISPWMHGMTKTLTKVTQVVNSPQVKAGIEGWARTIRSYVEPCVDSSTT